MTLPISLRERLRSVGHLWLLALLTVTSLSLTAQDGSVACNSLVQVSLGANCQAEITPDVVLEGMYPSNINWSVQISNVTGTIVSSPGQYTVTVTNMDSGVSCWGMINVEDKLAPIVDDCQCPPGNTDIDCEYLCTDLEALQNGTLAVPSPVVTEACGPITTDTSDVVVDGTCGMKVFTRTLLFTDPSGNTSTCVQEFRLNQVPFSDVMRPISPVSLGCGADPSPDSIVAFYTPIVGAQAAIRYGYPTVNGQRITSQMCNINSVYTDTETPVCEPQCSNSVKIIRRYIVLDWCNGDVDEYVQIIEAKDTTPPTIEAADQTTSVDPWGCAGSVVFDPPTTLQDDCTDYVNYSVSGPAGVSVSFNATLDRWVASDITLGASEFYYIGEDCCGNSSIDTVIVTVRDQSAPIAVAKEHIVVSLTTGNGTGQAKIFAASVDNGSHDGCTAIHLEIRRDSDSCAIVGNTTYNDDGHSNDDVDDTDDGQFVKFCCEDIDQVDADGIAYGRVKVWLRVWDDGDQDGTFGSAGDNYNETWAMVRVDDKLPPQLTCPSDVTLQCFDDIDDLSITGTATGTFTCGPADVDYVDISDDRSDCGFGTVVRQWFISTAPNITCIQRITIEESDLFDGDIDWPADRTTTCVASQPTDEPTWVGTPCSSIAYTVQSDTFQFVDDVCFKVLNNYTVIDWCQFDPQDPNAGRWHRTQIIKVNDDEAPELTMCSDTVFAVNDIADVDNDGNTCEAIGLTLHNTATDGGACASRRLRWEIRVDIDGNGSIDYEYTSFVPSNDNTFDDDNNNGIADRYLAPTNSGDPVHITLNDEFDGPSSNGKVYWNVTDGCGNTASCTTHIEVVDNKPPTPYCISLSTALMEISGTVELWAVDFNLGSFDNCTAMEDLLYTFDNAVPILSMLDTEHFFKGNGQPATAAEYAAGTAQRWIPATRTSGRVFGCDAIPETDVRMTVHDLQGNSDFCDVTLTVVDNNGACDGGGASRIAVSGSVITEDGMALENAEIILETEVIDLDYITSTDAAGNYAFPSVVAGIDYTLTGDFDGSYDDGVSTLDLVLIQRHILGLRSLDNPYKVIAADINGSENVTGADVVELRKLILGITDEMPTADNWLLIDADFTFADNNSPWPVKRNTLISGLSADISKDLVAIKLGDVNASATGNLQSGDDLDSRSAPVTYYYQDATIDGQTQVDIMVADDLDVQGMQLALDLGNLAYVDIIAGSLPMSQQDVRAMDGKVLVSYAGKDMTTAQQGDVLFSVIVDASSTTSLSKELSLAGDLTPEVYAGSNMHVHDLELASSRGSVTPSFVLFQNQPNPFKEETTIRFVLPKAAKANLTIYDISGRVVYNHTDAYDAGVNAITINQSLISTSGVLYYRLQSGDLIATRKMIQIQ